MRRLFVLSLLLLPAWTAGLPASSFQQDSPATSACHAFIDYQFIWTLEVIQEPGQSSPVPILNIITLVEGQWDLRPSNIHLTGSSGREAEIDRFAIDTGVPGEPYNLHYLKVLGSSFIGMDLIGDFQGFAELQKVTIDLGESRFVLEPIDCLDFETVAHRINQINYESPDIRQDFEVLQIDLMGHREARRRFY